jgi:hypothetical protein
MLASNRQSEGQWQTRIRDGGRTSTKIFAEMRDSQLIILCRVFGALGVPDTSGASCVTAVSPKVLLIRHRRTDYWTALRDY